MELTQFSFSFLFTPSTFHHFSNFFVSITCDFWKFTFKSCIELFKNSIVWITSSPSVSLAFFTVFLCFFFSRDELLIVIQTSGEKLMNEVWNFWEIAQMRSTHTEQVFLRRCVYFLSQMNEKLQCIFKLYKTSKKGLKFFGGNKTTSMYEGKLFFLF